MSNLIKAATLTGKKDPTDAMFRRMIVTGGRQQLKAWLARTNYGGESPVAVPVFTLDLDTPRIKASRWHLQGKLQRDVGFLARDLFSSGGAEKILIKIPDLNMFEFNCGSGLDENVSAWLEARTLNMRVLENGSELDDEEIESRGLANFCLRACLQPQSVAQALLWIAAVPLNKAELLDKRPTDYNTRKCPQIHLGIGPREAPGQRSLAIRLAVAEAARDDCGFGIYPALENLSPNPPILPPPRDVRECLHLFMRRAGGFNPKSVATIGAALEVPSETIVTKEPVAVWPELPTETATTGTESG